MDNPEMEAPGFDDFSIELEDYSVTRSGKFDRVWKWGEGGSIFQHMLLKDGVVFFGSCNHNLYAADLATGREIWRFRTSGPMVNTSPVESGGKVIIGNYDHNVYAIDARTGRLGWRFPTNGKIVSVPFASGGKVYIGSADQNVYALNGDSGRLIWKFQTYDRISSTPTECKGKVYFGSFDHNFYCVSARDGSLIWKLPTQAEIHIMNPVLILDGVVYFGSFDSHLYAADADSGEIRWKLKTGQYGQYMSPVYSDGTLFLSSRDNALHAISLKGREIWRFPRNDMLCIPVVHEGRIFTGCEDHNMYCIGMDGKEKWRFRTQGGTYIRPAASGNLLVFSSWDCNAYCIDTGTRSLVWKFRTEGSPGYIPPPHECFTLTIKPDNRFAQKDDPRKKEYELDLKEDGGNIRGGFYKSRVTYQSSTRYREKGKYQAGEDF